MITVNNENGRKLLEQSAKYLEYDVTERELALRSCKHLDEHPSENPERAGFFQLFNEGGYYAAAKKYITARNKTNLLVRVAKKIKRVLTLKCK